MVADANNWRMKIKMGGWLCLWTLFFSRLKSKCFSASYVIAHATQTKAFYRDDWRCSHASYHSHCFFFIKIRMYYIPDVIFAIDVSSHLAYLLNWWPCYLYNFLWIAYLLKLPLKINFVLLLTLCFPLQFVYHNLSEVENYEGVWCCWNRYELCVTTQSILIFCMYLVLMLLDEFGHSQALRFAAKLHALAIFSMFCIRLSLVPGLWKCVAPKYSSIICNYILAAAKL